MLERENARSSSRTNVSVMTPLTKAVWTDDPSPPLPESQAKTGPNAAERLSGENQ
jgi:hypothetical protein